VERGRGIECEVEGNGEGMAGEKGWGAGGRE